MEREGLCPVRTSLHIINFILSRASALIESISLSGLEVPEYVIITKHKVGPGGSIQQRPNLDLSLLLECNGKDTGVLSLL